MRFHLLTVEEAQQFGDKWRIAPSVRLHSMPPTMLLPLTGEEIELRLPDGRVLTAHVDIFGVDMWEDNEGNLFTTTDPSDVYLTLTITCASDVKEVPPGTAIWLSNARYGPAPEAS